MTQESKEPKTTSNKREYYNITVRGIKLKVAKDAMDDMEVVELMGAIQNGEIFAFPKLAKLLFGEDGYKTAKDGLADKNGRTRLTDMAKFFEEVMTACNAVEAKN